MQDFNLFMEKLEAVAAEVALFKSKPTKASSQRIRGGINDIKKLATAAKKDLIDNDANLGRVK